MCFAFCLLLQKLFYNSVSAEVKLQEDQRKHKEFLSDGNENDFYSIDYIMPQTITYCYLLL